MSIWRDIDGMIKGEHGEYIGQMNPANLQAQVIRDHQAIEWARQELKNYLDLPMLGATSADQYRLALEKVATLKDVLRIADAPTPQQPTTEEARRPWNSFDAARSTAHVPVDVWDLIYPKSENLDQRVHNAQIVEAYTRGQISITKYGSVLIWIRTLVAIPSLLCLFGFLFPGLEVGRMSYGAACIRTETDGRQESLRWTQFLKHIPDHNLNVQNDYQLIEPIKFQLGWTGLERIKGVMGAAGGDQVILRVAKWCTPHRTPHFDSEVFQYKRVICSILNLETQQQSTVSVVWVTGQTLPPPNFHPLLILSLLSPDRISSRFRRLAGFIGLPSDENAGNNNCPGGDPFRPCHEYIPPWRVILAALSLFGAGVLLFRGDGKRDTVCLALGMIFFAGVMLLVGHRYYCAGDENEKEGPLPFPHNCLIVPHKQIDKL